MQRRKVTLFLALLATFILVYSSVGYYLLSKPPAQPFMAMGVYSEAGLLANYYPGSTAPSITVGQQVNWHFQITNKMGSMQLTKITFRLANATSVVPTESVPSNATEIGESAVFIPNGDNSTVPFDWKILSTTNSGGLTYLNLVVNGNQVSPKLGAQLGTPPAGYRFIFEIWTLNEQTGAFQYTSDGRVGTWTSIWFDVLP